MKNLSSVVCFLLVFYCFSCNNKKDVVLPITSSSIDFANLALGQKNEYVKYESLCENFQDNIEFKKDTLLVEIVEENGSIYTFRESLTRNSASFGQMNMEEYEVYFEEDYLLIPTRDSSALFWFYANDTLQLRPTDMVDLLQNGCSLRLGDNLFQGNDIGTVTKFDLDEITIQDKMAVSCEPFLDLDAYLFYNQNGLNCSHVVFDEFNVRGWLLLEE